MVDINQTNEEIGSLLFKIEEQFGKILQQGHQFSMIETDIAIRDIQKLYERFQDLRSYAANRRTRADEPVLIFDKPIAKAEEKKEAPVVAKTAEVAEPITTEASKEKEPEIINEPSKVEAKVEVVEVKVEAKEVNTESEKSSENAEKPVSETSEKKNEPVKSNDWQRTFESKTTPVAPAIEPKKDLLQERERDFVPIVKKIEPKPEPVVQEAPKKESLFEKAASLYDKIAKPVDRSIATQASRQPISNIKSAIGVNEKFIYLKELFKNNINEYNECLEKLNNFDNYAAAEDFFQELKNKYNWDPDSKSFQGLAELMARRYL